ncbi:hypothetical protein THAOC_25024, partial [Thalassiosira oceanica]
MSRWVSSKPDYFLASPRVRKRLRVARPREFPHHDTDHRAIVAKIWVRGERRRLETYRRNAKRNPLLCELPRPLRQSEQLFEELRSTVARRERRSHPQMSWISDRTWALVGNRASARLRRNGSLMGRVSRQLGRRIGSSLQQDRKERARRAGAAIEAALADSDLQLGWDKAKRWHREARGAPAQPNFQSHAVDGKADHGESETLFDWSPPGDQFRLMFLDYSMLGMTSLMTRKS